MMRLHRYLTARPDAKGNAVFCSNSKLMPDTFWNESKLCRLRQIKNTCGLLAEFSALIAASPGTHGSSPIEARPFIEHLSEVWNFSLRQTASMLSYRSTRKVRP
jgi:hypothetical protein